MWSSRPYFQCTIAYDGRKAEREREIHMSPSIHLKALGVFNFMRRMPACLCMIGTICIWLVYSVALSFFCLLDLYEISIHIIQNTLSMHCKLSSSIHSEYNK